LCDLGISCHPSSLVFLSLVYVTVGSILILLTIGKSRTIKIVPNSIAQVLEMLIVTEVIFHLESDEPSQNTYTLFLYVPY
jgi:hypothetical protein